MIKFDILKVIKESSLEEMFQINFQEQTWVWVNSEIFADLVLNVIDYEEEEEEMVFEKIRNVGEKDFLNIINEKMERKGWIEVNQKIFEELEEGFKVTTDIETYIFVQKKYYNHKMMNLIREKEWILKAMAIDTFQHLSLGFSNVEEAYEENFSENGRIIEEVLINGKYEFNQGMWRYCKKNNLLEFYKNGKNYRQWTEGNTNFIFHELNQSTR